MTVAELKKKLDEMPDEAHVCVLDAIYERYRILSVVLKESSIHEFGVVEIQTA